MRAKEHLVADLKEWANVDPAQFLDAAAELIDHATTIADAPLVEAWLNKISPTLETIDRKVTR